MRKLVSLVLVVILVMGCAAAFAGQASSNTKLKTEHTVAKTFFADLQKLFTEQIPNTEKSATYGLDRNAQKQEK